MPTERLSMRRIRDVLRLKYAQGLSARAIAASLGLGNPLIEDYEKAQDSVGEAFSAIGLTRGERRKQAFREAIAKGEMPPPRRDHGQAAVHKLDGHSEHDLGEGASSPSRTSTHSQRRDRSEDIAREDRKPSMKERLEGVLNKPRAKLDRAEDREQERDGDEKENTRDRDRGEGHSQ